MGANRDTREKVSIPGVSGDLSAGSPVNKWGYAILAGIIALAYAEEPGGISALEGFVIAFIAVFLAIFLIELIARPPQYRKKAEQWSKN